MENANVLKDLKRSGFGFNSGIKHADPMKLQAARQRLKDAGKKIEAADKLQAPAPLAARAQTPVPAVVQQAPAAKAAPQAQAQAPAQQPQSARGLFVGLTPDGAPFYRAIGQVTDIEYLALVKFAEMQYELTLSNFNPTSNGKIVDLLKQVVSNQGTAHAEATPGSVE